MSTTLPILPMIFVAFTSMLIVSAGLVVLSKNPVKSALFLVLSFFAAAGLWMLLEAEFLSLVLLLVYVGAVMTLFLFVIMTLNVVPERARAWHTHLFQGALVLFALLGLMLYVWHRTTNVIPDEALTPVANFDNTQALGRVLYTIYMYPFELVGILLLVAMVAAIALSWRVDRRRRVQDIPEQLKVTKADRLKIVRGE